MTDTVQTIPVPQSDEGVLRDILRPRNSANTSGFQRAHIIGQAFIRDNMRWLADLFGPNGANSELNGVLLPEGNRGGLLLGVAEHFGNDVAAFNRLLYDVGGVDAEGEPSKKHLNVLQGRLELALDGIEDQTEINRINKEYRVDARNFLDFVKIQFLHQDILDNLKINDDPVEGLKSLALNSADVRFQSAAEVTAHLNGLVGQFDLATVEKNKLYQEIAKIRSSLPDPDVDISRQLIEAIPDTSRILYPVDADGVVEILWDEKVQADIHSRNTYIGLNLGLDRRFDRTDYDGFRQGYDGPDGQTRREVIAAWITDLRTDNRGELTLFASEADVKNQILRRSAAAANINDFDRYIAAVADDALRFIEKVPVEIADDVRRIANRIKAGFEGIDPVKARRLLLTAGGALLALTELWVESERRGGFTSPEFLDWAAEAAKDALIALPILGAGVYLANLTPLGPVVNITLATAGAYLGVRNIAEGLTEVYAPQEGEEPGLVFEAAQGLLSVFEAIEGPVLRAVELAAEFLGNIIDGSINLLQDWVIDNVDFVGGDSAILIEENTEATSSTDLSSNWVIGEDNALVIGNDKNNFIVLTDYGEALGEAGDDILLAWSPSFFAEGDVIDEALANEAAELWNEYDIRIIAGEENVPIPDLSRDAGRATEELRAVLDGGEGDDWVLSVGGGEGSIVIGGEGSDLLYNNSYKGQLWGDGLDGRGVTFSGEENSDTFWWSSGSFIMDASANDRLQLFGVPLIGGTNNGLYGLALEKGVARDFFLPWVTYGLTSSNQLLVEALSFGQNLDPNMSEDEILEIAQVVENWESGDLGIEFTIFGEGEEISLLRTLFQFIGDFADAAIRFAKNLTWRPSDDPLVLDLNGDGLVSKGIGALYWDNDGDLFGERSGWLSGEDGFLVHDADGDGQITASELFGGPGLSGFDELSDWDTNGDNIVDANDVAFGDLQIWRDANEDGITDAGELHALSAFDVTAFSLNAQPTNLITANGTTIRAESFYARADGTTGALGELIFETDPADTQYLGDGRVAGFVPEGANGTPIDAFGYGITTDLAVAASNDLELAQLIESTAAAMTVPDLDALRDQARSVLGAWARSHSDSLELGAVLVGADGALVDYAIYNEDENGGFWALESGADVLASDGSAIARASFEDVLAQGAGADASWQVVQGWSPSSRAFTPENRLETGYLISTDGAAAVLDYAIRQSDAQGDFWSLASGNDVLASDGSVIARASLSDITAQAAATGTEWRVEDFAEPIPDAGFDRAAFYLRDGVVTDYSIWVDDGNGLFAVWASVFEQALDTQERFGPNSFGLRGFELDLDNLPDADNSDDSAVRVEIMSLDEIQYAFASGGETFRPELFVAQSASDNTLSYDFDIDDTKVFTAALAESYLAIGRAMAVRIAVQGGLSQYFEGVQYDAASDTFQATSNRELIPLFTAILADAPTGGDETVDYLRDWNRVLQTVYPDFKRNGRGPRSQAFLMQMIVAGFENSPVDASFLQVAEALSIDEERVLVAEAGNSDVEGTRGDDLIYIADGATSARGGLGSDVYIVGRDFGEVVIQDVEPIFQPSSSDYLRFAHLTPDDVFVTKDGADLIIQEIGTDNILTIRNQFEGRWPGIFGGDFSDNTEITEINFADGTSWDFVDMAYAASHPLDSNDVVFGTDSIDVLDGGAGNDILRGGGDSDLYIFDYGYGEDRIIDAENNPFRQGVDLVSFGEGIDADRLSFERIGASNDLIVHLLDESGERTGDILTIEGQFFQQDAFITTLKPNQIEILAFSDGTFLDEGAIRQRVVAEARTDGADAIWAFDDAETLDGGAGDDLLVGQDGADTYIFARGYGNDVIQDRSFEIGLGVTETVNTLELQGINAADVEILRDPGSATIALRIKDTGETVTLKNQFEVTFAFFIVWRDNVDLIRFADGTVWDQGRLGREVLGQERTDGDDTIIGFDWSDTLDGGLGNDRLEGGLFNDTYIFREGYGNDTVFDTGAGKALLLPAGFDTLDLQGIDLVDVEFSRQANDLTLTLRSTGESVTLEGQYDRLGDTVIEELRFNGASVDWRDLGADVIDLVGTSGDDTLIGTHYAERIDGRAGNDVLIGSSDGDTYVFDIGYGQDVINDRIDTGRYRAADSIEFGPNASFADVRFTKEGNDLLISFEGFTDSVRVLDQFGSVLSGVENFVFADGNALTIADVEEQLLIAGGTRGDNILNALDDRTNILDGRQGDDQLNGGSFSDTYLFGVEYGFDTITEKLDSQSQNGAVDRVVFGRLVDPEDVVFRADGTNLVVTIPSSGEQLTIVDGLGNRQIEEFNFFDGTIWGQAEIRTALLRSTDGDDMLIGFDNTDDLLAGGFGSDLLIGRAGDDTYRFGIGDGLDAIEDSDGVDRIELGAGISAEMVRFEQVDEGLLIRITGFEDSLLIRDGLSAGSVVESVVLSDGYTFEFEDIRNFLVAAQETPSDDIVTGFANRNDQIVGGVGNDELNGLTGDDVYVIGENPGLDIVSDTGGFDRIRFTEGRSDQLQVRRLDPSTGDIAIGFAGVDGETIVRGAIDGAGRVEEYEFANGVVLSLEDMRTQIIASASSDGNDLIQGFNDPTAPSATFDGGRGDDIIVGQASGDTFVFRRLDGSDTIIDTGAGTDTLRVEGYAREDLTFERLFDGSADVLVSFAGTDDQIILRGQLSNAQIGIEVIEFSDAQNISRADISAFLAVVATEGDDILNGTSLADVIDAFGGDDTVNGSSGNDTLSGGAGNDTINGALGADTFIGGAGNDRLFGGSQNDTYVFNLGDGQDVIRDERTNSRNSNTPGTDAIAFGDGIDVSMLRFSTSGSDLLIQIAGASDRILIDGGFRNRSGKFETSIENLNFADGSTISYAEIVDQLVLGTDGNDDLRDDSYDNTISGGLGDDTIDGWLGSDTLIGGKGNDTLLGGSQNDTYIFNLGDGQDTISDVRNNLSNANVPGVDKIVFGEGIEQSMLRFSSSGSSLVIDIDGSSDRITVIDGLGDTSERFGTVIETLEFFDGSILTHSEVVALLSTDTGTLVLDGTSEDDVISGADGDETINGFGGNDYLSGGHDNDRLDGGDGDDILEGGGGADTLVDASGDETYRFALGDGRDLIVDDQGTDTVEFGAGIAISDLRIERTADDMVIHVGVEGDRITLSGAVWDPSRIIENFSFADGSSASFADLAALAPFITTGANAFNLTDNGDIFTGSEQSESIGGAGGDDTIFGGDGDDSLSGGIGDDILSGETGNDTILGGAGNDTIDGGSGDDNLQGGDGDDTYFWNRGDGQDRIIDSSGIDTIELGADITIADLIVLRNGTSNLELRIAGTSDRLVVDGALANAANQIETILFADGTTLNHDDLFAFATLGTPRDDFYQGLNSADELAGAAGDDRIFGNGGNDTIRGDDGNDQIYGGAGDDNLTGGAGSDLLLGGEGSDTYNYAFGEGRDVIVESAGTDTVQISGATSADLRVRRFEEGNNDLLLDFGAGNSLLLVDALTANGQIESVVFVDDGEIVSAAELAMRAISDLASAESDVVVGTSGDDFLTGEGGDDILIGGLGNDIYEFNLGDGNDRIIDSGGSADRIVFTAFTAADISGLFRSPPAGFDLIINFASGDTAILADALRDGDEGIDLIEFSDGTVITPDDLRADLLAGFNTSSDAQIYGFSGADILAGGAGNDALFGLGGDDTYIYRAGDGNDRIEDNGGGTDRIVIEGYSSTDVRLSRLFYASTGVAIDFNGSAQDSLTVINLTAEGEDRIEFIEFADDGVVWDFATIEALIGNNAPVTNPDGFRDVVQGTVLEIDGANLLSNDFDADGDPLSIQSLGEVSGGIASLRADGVIEFDADPDFTGFASIAYLVSDGRQGVTEASVTIRVRPEAIANDDIGISVLEDGTLVIRDRDLLANDVDGDRFEVSQVKDAINGTVSLSSNGDITFTPFAEFSGTATFVYVANTPDGGRDEALVEIDVLPVNDAPVARNDATGLSTDEGVPLVIDVATVASLLDNDNDIDGDSLTISGVFGDGNITAELQENGTVLINPLGDFFGAASFTYLIDDGAGGSASAVATLLINPVNDAPVTAPDSFVTDEDNPLFFSGDELTANDIDPDGTPVVISGVRSAIGGNVELFENNTILFTPNANFFGNGGFTYVVDDGDGGVTSQTVSIEVNPINDAPTAIDDRPFGRNGKTELISQQDQVMVIDPSVILANDFDIDSSGFSLDTVSGAINGTVELADDGLIYFTPDPDYWGFANFRYVISDDQGLVDDANVSVYFRPTGNVAPVAVDDNFTGSEDQPLIITREQLLENDFDPNDDAIEIVGSVTRLGASANEILDWFWNDNGDLVVVPIPDLPGSATLFYTISDGVFTDEARIDISFAPVDDAPTAADDGVFDSGFGRPVVLRIADLKANDFDIDDSIWLSNGGFAHNFGAANLDILDALSTTQGTASIYDDEFIVIEIAPAFSGDLTLGYTLSDQTGLTGQADAAATVRAERDLLLEGSDLRDLLIGSADAETLVGFDGDDDLFGRDGDDVLRGGDGADLLDGGEGFDIADFSDSLVAMRVDINSRIGQGGFAQGDELVSIEGLIGGAGSDQLFGTDEVNTIEGGAGDDFIDGRAGDDTLAGDEGDDTLIGAEGADSLDGGEGSDTADYSGSVDPISVSLADSTASGGDAEGDTLISIENLIGTLGDDILTGEDGANTLIGGRGADTISAGAGDDLIEGGRGGDIIDGGEGVDTARYWLSESGVSIDLAAGTASGGDAEGDQISNVENIIGSAHADTITGDAADNVIVGGAGGDTLDGGDGIDTLNYSDSVDGVALNLTTGIGSSGDAAGDSVSNFENVTGSRFADQISGDAGDNLLDGSLGDDELTGADGSDRYLLARGSGSDTVFESTSLTDNDTLEIVGDFGADAVSIYADGDDLVVELERGDSIIADQVRIKDHFLGDGAGIETLIFGDGTVWDRATIEANSAASRLQAEGDLLVLVDEDAPFTFTAADLLVNDVAADDAVLSVVSVEALSGGSVTLNPDSTITFLGEEDFNGDAFFRYRMTDGTGRISSAVVEVNVRPVNDTPVAVDDDGSYVVDEDGSVSIPIAWLLANDSDIDGDTLTINGFEPVDGGNGTANIEQAGFVTFRPDADYNGAAAFRYRVSDGNGGFAFANVSLEVLPVNDAPRPANDAETVRSGRDILISVASLLANDGDPEGDAFSFAGIGTGVNGSAALEIVDGEQFIRFTPDDGFLGAASFTYSVNEDATGLAGTATVDVTVIPANDPPVANGETLEGLEDTPLVISQAELLANDSDPNGDTLVISRLDDFPEQGSVAFDGEGNIVFTPAPDYNGPASFKYWVSDGEFEIEATASIEVAPVNDAPVVVDDEGPFIGDEDKVFIVRAADVFGNDSDREGDVLEFAEFETDIGTIVKEGQNLLLTPPLNYNGPISVRYRARDDKGAISEDFATVTIEISDIPDAPEAVADAFTTAEDTPIELLAADLIGNDTDVDSTELTLVSVDNAVGGVISLENGVVTFTPNTDFFGEASFDYLVTDGDTNPVQGSVTIDVTPVNDPVRVTGDSFASDEDVALNLAPSAFLANDIDPDGDTITITAVTALTDGASAVIEADGTITLTPPANENGQIRFEYTVSDEAGLETTGQVSVFIAAVNDAPVLGTPLADRNSAEDSSFSFAIDPASFSDVDSSPLSLSASLADGSPLPEWLAFDGANLSGAPPQNFNGSLDITVTASDGELSVSDAFTLTIDPVNDAPILVQMLPDVSAQEDAAIAFALPEDAFTDADGDTLVLSAGLADGSDLPAWLSFDGESFTGTPPQDFNGSLVLKVVASDGEFLAEDTFSLTIDPVNDAPVLVQALGDVTSNEDAAISIAVPTETFADVDGDTLALSASLADGSDLPTWLSFDGESFTGIPPQDFNGLLDLTVTASDGEVSVSDSFSLTIDPVNDAPVLFQAIGDVSSPEDMAFSFDIPTETFADVDGDALTLSATLSDGSELPDWISFDGTNFTGTPPENFFGMIGLTVTATDGELTVSDSFTLQIASVNDAPILIQGLTNIMSPEDTAIAVAIPSNSFADLDGDALTLSASLADGGDLPAWLSFDGAAFTGTPPQDFNGMIDLSVTASDGELRVSDTFTLTIDPVNDAPVLVQALGDASFQEDSAFSVAVPTDTFDDIDGDALSLSASLADGSNLPTWLSFDGESFTGTPPQDFNGVVELTVTASDGGLNVSDNFKLTIDPLNDAPVLAQALADIASPEDAAFSAAIPAEAFADVDGDDLTLIATLTDGSDLPTWLSFDGTELTGTPPQNFNGSLGLTVTASDGQQSVSSAFTLTIDPVNDAPILVQALADIDLLSSDSTSIDVSDGVFSDVEGDTLTYSVALADGSAVPAWLEFDGTVLTATDIPNQDAALNVVVTASDGTLSVSDEFAITIEAEDTNTGDSEGFSFSSLNSWYNPAYGGGYNVTFEYEVQPEAIAEGELRAWDIFAAYSGPGTISNGWVSGFPGPATFEVTAEGATFSTDGLNYQPELAEGQTFQITLRVDNAPYTAGEFAFEIFDRDPEFNLADNQDTTLTVAPTNDWGGGLAQNVSFTNTSDTGIDNWQMVLSTPDGVDLTITNVSGASVTQLANGDFLFEALSWNEEVAPGGQANFAFNANYSGVSSLSFDQGDFSFTDSDARQFDVVVESLGSAGNNAVWSYGTANDDDLIGDSAASNRIFGAVGDDTLTGGGLGDWLAGGSGDDALYGLDGDDVFWGGHGNDLLFGGLGYDTVQLLGEIDSYSIVTQAGSLGVQINDLSAIAHGDDGMDQLSSIEQLAFRGGETLNITSPIILDLGGDGITTLSSAESNARFDLDGDGLADDTSWISGNDAFLYLDRDANGTVSGVEEISFIDDVPNAATDLDGLTAFDTNSDGALDANDARFDEFGVWLDADGDGAVDEGETASLAQVGIASIGLTGTAVNGTVEFGEVAIANTGSFTLTNGVTREFADAALTYFSAATNMSELSETNYTFDRKAKKYRIHIGDGTANVGRKRLGSDGTESIQQLGANTLLTFGSKTYGRFAPVVLDLDGDGIELVKRKKSNASFDYNDNGTGSDTGWISGDDGFLVIDRNNDGLITEASELSLAAEGADASTGLQGLATMDSNRDGVVDASDARFSELRVWQDRNGNGRTDAGELRTLEEAGIVSISLAATALQDRVKVTKNALVATSSFTRTNGTTSTVADVSLAYQPIEGTSAAAVTDLGARGSLASFNTQLFADLIGFQSQLPTNDEIFDLLRSGDNDALTGFFGIPEPSDVLAGSISVSPNQVTALSEPEFTSEGFDGQLLQVMPSERISIEQFNDPELNLEVEDAQASNARRLMMISQDMAVFGAPSGMDASRLDPRSAYIPELFVA